MVSLVDIGPLTKDVPFRGNTIKVQGVPANALFHMLTQYPEMRKLLSGQFLEADLVQSLFALVPNVVADIIAAGLGNTGKTAEIEAASKLPLGEQYDLVYAIVDVTFPQGIASFVDGLSALARGVDARGWGQDTKSPVPSVSASRTATTSQTAGNEPPDNSAPGQSSLPESKQLETQS